VSYDQTYHLFVLLPTLCLHKHAANPQAFEVVGIVQARRNHRHLAVPELYNNLLPLFNSANHLISVDWL
jgi:hypothetical protein